MRYLIGLGNYSMSDDSIGLRLVEHIAENNLDNGFETVEAANNGMLVLTYFREDTELLLIVDAVNFGSEAGEFLIFSPEDVDSQKVTAGISTHEGDILKLIELAKRIDQPIPPIRILAIQPGNMELGDELSPTLTSRFPEYIKAAVDAMQG